MWPDDMNFMFEWQEQYHKLIIIIIVIIVIIIIIFITEFNCTFKNTVNIKVLDKSIMY